MSEDSGFIGKKKPQIKAPRVTPLEGVYTSTVAPVDVAHTYGSPPYVDIAARYALQGIRVSGVENPQGFGIDERRCGLDFFGSLGKGMLPKENIETLGNSSGLTPLGFGFNVRNRIMDRYPVGDGFSITEFTENTEVLKNSAGLTPLRPFGKNHKKEVLE